MSDALSSVEYYYSIYYVDPFQFQMTAMHTKIEVQNSHPEFLISESSWAPVSLSLGHIIH